MIAIQPTYFEIVKSILAEYVSDDEVRALIQFDNALLWKVDIVDCSTTSEKFRAIILQKYEVVQGK
ncbi:hypothetical protein [Pasteurella sp. PK-2025]|uniref:hypothetical protein n=1 Tax=Pasteurella sp. PK-2025 TaxID=3413133 RepID=UPI003C786FF8